MKIINRRKYYCKDKLRSLNINNDRPMYNWIVTFGLIEADFKYMDITYEE